MEVYFIEIFCEQFIIDDLYNDLYNFEKDIFDIIDSEFYFSYEIENVSYVYIMTEKDVMEQYYGILRKNGIELFYQNISQEVIMNGIDDLSPFINERNSSTVDYFLAELERWIFDNLTIDKVLDRINLHGYENIRQIDKDFLVLNTM